jgi:hypothetical protein
MEGVLSSIKEQSPYSCCQTWSCRSFLTALITMKRPFGLTGRRVLASELSWRDGTKIGRTAVYELYSDGLKQLKLL